MKMFHPKYFLFLFVQLCMGHSVFSQNLPVVPLPQIVKEGNHNMALDNIDVQVSKGSNVGNLIDLWSSYFGEQPYNSSSAKKPLLLGILGDNPDFDAMLLKEVQEDQIATIGDEGYVLVLRKKRFMLAAHSKAGLFYGLQTLRQLISSEWDKEVVVIDWPDFPERIIMDDISRGPISTFDYIKQQIDRLAALKINALTFYVEKVIQSPTYPDFTPGDGKLTLSQIRELSDYAAQNYMQLIGTFQSFGHFEKILAYPQYKDMGATSTMISPIDPKAKLFLQTILEEYIDAFNSPYFNVFCDETWDIGRGTTKVYADSVGIPRFYAEHINFLHGILAKKNKKMMMAGDIILKHEEILDMVPKDIMYLTWEYGAKKDFSPWIKPFADRKLDFMVTPGILNSNRLFPDLTMARTNINEFSKAGYKTGAKGVFTTIWDDGGIHLFSNDWSGVGFAAEKSWNIGNTPKFNERYSQVNFGCSNTYFQAVEQLLKLNENPLTFAMGDAIWKQQLLPEAGHSLVVETVGLKEALENIKNAKNILKDPCAQRNQMDMQALELIVDQYHLLLQSKQSLLNIAGDYKQASKIQVSHPTKARGILIDCMAKVGELNKMYGLLANRFRQAWLRENQIYGLDYALEFYKDKERSLYKLEEGLYKQITYLDLGLSLAPPLQIGLDLQENNKIYFKNWLLLGSIPLDTLEVLPDFTYNPDPKKDIPPVKGTTLTYKGKEYQWTDFQSIDGSVINLRKQFTSNEKSVAYAYCSLDADQAKNVKAIIGSNDGMEVFVNGKLIHSKIIKQPFIIDETEIILPLKNGRNDILLRISQWKGEWQFSFRLDHEEVRYREHNYFTLKN